jgi:hypothetical protein
MQTSNKPVFEIKTLDGKIYRLWADGRMEGFPDGVMITRHIDAVATQSIEHGIASFYDSTWTNQFTRRILTIALENDEELSEQGFARKTAYVLRKLAGLIDQKVEALIENKSEVGIKPRERFVTVNTIISTHYETLTMERIQDQTDLSVCPVLVAGYQKKRDDA